MVPVLNYTKYKARHEGCILPNYQNRPAIYDKTIADAATVGVRANTKTVCQVKLEDWKLFDCTQRKLQTFILTCLDDRCICEFRDPVTGYTHVHPRVIMEHMWKSCSGPHSIDVLALCTKNAVYASRYYMNS